MIKSIFFCFSIGYILSIYNMDYSSEKNPSQYVFNWKDDSGICKIPNPNFIQRFLEKKNIPSQGLSKKIDALFDSIPLFFYQKPIKIIRPFEYKNKNFRYNIMTTSPHNKPPREKSSYSYLLHSPLFLVRGIFEKINTNDTNSFIHLIACANQDAYTLPTNDTGSEGFIKIEGIIKSPHPVWPNNTSRSLLIGKEYNKLNIIQEYDLVKEKTASSYSLEETQNTNCQCIPIITWRDKNCLCSTGKVIYNVDLLAKKASMKTTCFQKNFDPNGFHAITSSENTADNNFFAAILQKNPDEEIIISLFDNRKPQHPYDNFIIDVKTTLQKLLPGINNITCLKTINHPSKANKLYFLLKAKKKLHKYRIIIACKEANNTCQWYIKSFANEKNFCIKDINFKTNKKLNIILVETNNYTLLKNITKETWSVQSDK